jgi:hypothetical protein
MSKRKIIIIIPILFFTINQCFAQEISIRGGLNLSQFWWEYDDIVGSAPGAKQNPGFNIGPILELPVTKLFSFETGLLFTSKGHKSSVELNGAIIEGRRNLFYLEVPVLCKITVPIKRVGIFATAGPYIGEALYGKQKEEITENSVSVNKWEGNIKWGDEPHEYDRFDYGLKFGAGLQYYKWQIGACYELGLKNFSNMNQPPSEVSIKNRVWELYISYALTNLKSNKK